MSRMIVSFSALRAVEREFLDHHDEIKAKASRVTAPEEYFPFNSLINRAVDEMLGQSRRAARHCERYAGAIRDYVTDVTDVDQSVSASAEKGRAS